MENGDRNKYAEKLSNANEGQKKDYITELQMSYIVFLNSQCLFKLQSFGFKPSHQLSEI